MQAVDSHDVALRLNSVAIHVVRRARQADRALGIPPAQLSALSVLVLGGDRSLAELAAAEHVRSPTMTRIVDGLEHAGLAERRPDARDRRAVVVRATAKGRRVMERGRRARVELLADLLGGLSPQELAAVGAATDALARLL